MFTAALVQSRFQISRKLDSLRLFKMKVLFSIIFVVALVQVNSLTDKQKELLAQHYKECAEKSKVDQAVLQKARSGEFADDSKLKDHILCVTQKIGFQNEKGELQKDVIEKKLKEALKGDENKTKEVLKDCALANSDPKLQAFNAFKCVYQKANISLL